MLLVSMPDKSFRENHSIVESAERFFDEAEGLPHRSLYTVSLRASGRELGKLVASFALDSFREDLTQRLANFAGEQLGMLLERIRLTRHRRQLVRELVANKDVLATRIALQRAEGVLVERLGLDLPSARSWIVREVVQTGLSPREVAKQVIEEEQRRREADGADRVSAIASSGAARGYKPAARAPWQPTPHSFYAKHYPPGM